MNKDSNNYEQLDIATGTEELQPPREARIDLSRKAILDAEQLLKASEQLLKELAEPATAPDISSAVKVECSSLPLNDEESSAEPQLGARACLPFSSRQPAAAVNHCTPPEEAQDAPDPVVAISATNLSKSFGKLEAVKNVYLNIPYGRIYGLLGARRSGKSTTLKLLTGLLPPTTGTCLIAGSEVNPDNRTTLRQLGYMSQKFQLHDELTVMENLQFYAAASSLPIKTRREKINWLLEFCDLDSVKDTKVQGLPRSIRQRTALGANILHEPSILLLDEPTAGLKPDHRNRLWQVISDFASWGNAVLVTTSFLSDAEYCHRLGFMLNGSIISEGSPEEIMDTAYRILRVESAKPSFTLKLLAGALETLLMAVFPRHVQTPEKLKKKIVWILNSLGVNIDELHTAPASYDDAFLKLSSRRRTLIKIPDRPLPEL